MTTGEAKNIIQSNLKCIELSELSTRKIGGPVVGELCNYDCDHCEYFYQRYSLFDRIEALKLAMQALENQ